jgi:hypothetical protein
VSGKVQKINRYVRNPNKFCDISYFISTPTNINSIGAASKKTFYYARYPERPDLDRQLEAFYKLGANEREVVTDKESGKNLDRAGSPALKKTMLRTATRKL